MLGLLNRIVLTIFISTFFLTLITPQNLFTKNPTNSSFWMLYFFNLKAVMFIFFFYGISMGKNFSKFVWNSKYNKSWYLLKKINYHKIFSGQIIEVIKIKSDLEKVNIFPIVKNENESARLAGFGVIFNEIEIVSKNLKLDLNLRPQNLHPSIYFDLTKEYEKLIY